jgi:hypothetical protein
LTAVWWIVLVVLLLAGAVLFSKFRGASGRWGGSDPDQVYDLTGRIAQPMDEQDFEKPRDEGDLL